MKITTERIISLLFASVCFLFFAFFAFRERQMLQERYDYGVGLYNSGKYVEARDVFGSFPDNWGRDCISADEYYKMCDDKILGVYYDYTAQG